MTLKKYFIDFIRSKHLFWILFMFLFIPIVFFIHQYMNKNIILDKYGLYISNIIFSAAIVIAVLRIGYFIKQIRYIKNMKKNEIFSHIFQVFLSISILILLPVTLNKNSIKGEYLVKIVYFNKNSTDFEKGKLDGIIDILKKNKELKILIAGHTDAYGNAHVNQKLSQKRAKAVRDYFVKKGIKLNSIKHLGYGTTYPIVDNNSDIFFKNRRVEIYTAKTFSEIENSFKSKNSDTAFN